MAFIKSRLRYYGVFSLIALAAGSGIARTPPTSGYAYVNLLKFISYVNRHRTITAAMSSSSLLIK